MFDKWQQTGALPSDSTANDGANDGHFQQALSKVRKLAKHDRTLDPVEQYLREIRVTPLLTKEEEIHFSRLALKGDEKARKRMIESNLRLVVKIARRYLRSNLSILDLIEEGNMGLMHAVGKFDPERGFRFSTYGAWWIQQTIERAIMNQSRTVRLPVHIVKQLNSYLRTERELSTKLLHEPRARDIAEALNKTNHEVEQIMSLNERALSMDQPASFEVDRPLLDTLKNRLPDDPAHTLNQSELKSKIEVWVNSLPAKQREVLLRRFGLLGYEVTTLDQTGKEIGLTRERVRQIQSEALKRLKRLIEGQGNNKETLLE